jgi:T-complex protein 1 subunit beta
MGENARLSSFVGAMALGDLVKSTLGPKGMNKILRECIWHLGTCYEGE